MAYYSCVATAGKETIKATTEVVTRGDGDCQELLEIKTWSPTVMIEQGTDVMLPCLHQLGGFSLPAFWNLRGESSSIPDSDKHYTTKTGNLDP